MNSITEKFYLKNSTTLVPVSGLTEVTVETTGKVLVYDNSESTPRESATVLAKTKHGRLTVSPKGRMMTVKLILPESQSSERNFRSELDKLYRTFYGDWTSQIMPA